mgnify:CR=1 FL=1
MSKHLLSRASQLYFGDAYHAGAFGTNERVGAPITPITKISLGSPAVSAATAAAAAQAVAGPGNLTLNGTLAAAGVVTFLTARNVQAVSTGAGDTTQTLTIYGAGHWGAPMVETVALNGTTVVQGKKAFKTITRIAVSAATVGNVSVGNSTALGLPYRLTAKSDLMQTWFNQVLEATVPTIVVGDATTATATTGDTKGTVVLNSALNGSAVSVYVALDPSTNESLFGVAQYSG